MTKPYYSDPPIIEQENTTVANKGDWIFCLCDAEENAVKVYYIPTDLNQRIRRSKATVTKTIKEFIRLYEFAGKTLSLTSSYVKCINLRENRFFNVSYKDWLETKGNYLLFEPKPSEVEVNEW